MSNYVTYHLHTELSLLDSCTNHKLYTDKAVELNQTAICFSEHGNIYNWIEKKMYANSRGLKYLHGCEVYLTESLNEKIRDNYHTILIAKNYEGVKELNTLIDLSTHEDHFYYKPRLTFDEFFNISDNIIKISACLASPLCRYPLSENADKELYNKLLQSYDYYEIQPHLSDDQRRYNDLLYRASQQYNIPLIAGTDTHSIDNYKAECRSILQKAKKIEYADEDKYDLTYKSYDELVEMFKQQASLPINIVLEAIENTNVMADSVEDFELDLEFKYPVIDNAEEKLKQRVNEGYKNKLAIGAIIKDPRYSEMVKEELRVFKKIGMISFMLFMSDLTQWCWENNIPVGFCRGSCGGSMIAYLTDIIDVNPIQWGTVFSRFANEDRLEIGDIDIDISPTQRQLVYDHIIETYGQDKTAYVLAIGTISDKGTIDDIARALAFSEDLRDKYSLSNTKKIKEIFETDPDQAREEYPELFYYFDGLVNTAVSQSMHPAGIIVSPITLTDNYGTFWNEDKQILSINMEEIHEVSLVKYDLLGLKNIEIIKDCCELAGIPYPKSYTVNWDDQDVWEHITDSPVGIFQFESAFAAQSLKKMQPRTINDMSMCNASIRPSGESYRDRLLNRETNKNPSELIDELLESNHGFLIFQEDTIKFLTDICGLSGSEADNIRRAIGRKQKDRLDAALPSILEGYCSMSNKPRKEAEEEAKIFLQIIEDSSNYQFGYNHSTGYSMIGYVCGYLRYYYPTEFVTAFLNNANNEDDINNGTLLAKQLGITIETIKFRHALSEYTCNAKDKIIYKGLGSIKYMNSTCAEELYELRDNQYDTFVDLLIDIKETSTNSRQLDILIKLGFFEEFGEPNELLKQVDLFTKCYGKKQIKLDKVNDLGVPIYILQRHAKKITEKMAKDFDSLELLKDVIKHTEMPKTTIRNRIDYENEHLGYISYTMPEVDEDYYYITKKSGFNNNMWDLYNLKTGNSMRIKCRAKNCKEVVAGDIIKVTSIINDHKWKKDGDNWVRLDDREDVLVRYNYIKI